MTRPLRVALAIVGFLVVTMTAIVILGYRLVNKSLPDYGKDLQLAILDNPVTVYWDKFRVPHIYAENDLDLFRAAGYLAAQERLWQMDLGRRAAAGTLSEIFGKTTLQQDIFLRMWGFHRISEKIANALSPESRRALEAYSLGINTYIAANSRRLPIEFSILGYKPKDWHITDSIGLIRMMGFQLNFTWHLELALQRIAAQYGLSNTLQLYPDFPADAPIIVSENNPALQPLLARTLDNMMAGRDLYGVNQIVAGSNSWVVAGKKSVSGKPLLANDPHLGLNLPSIWYEMHLVSPSYDVMGVTLPGVPGVVIGHNRAAAWGLTNGMIDDADYYIERIDAKDSTRYWDGTAWRQCEMALERIDIKNESEPLFLDVRQTQHGPIISDVHPLLKKDTLAVSLRWTGQDATDELAAFLKLNRAANWDDFVDAIKDFKVPCQNFVFADTSGTIGYYAAGEIPVRRDGKGYLPYNGWENAGDWVGFVTFDKLPHLKDPAAGFVATANNRMTGKEYPYYLSNAWEPDSRIQRIVELLKAKETLSPADFRGMHSDLLSAHARKMMTALRPILELASLSDSERKILQLFLGWDFRETIESPQAAIYNVFFVKLLLNTLQDELDETTYKEFVYWTNFPVRAMENLALHPEAIWWDNVKTPEKETMAEIVVKSFRDALADLGQKLGDGPGSWDWGRYHTLTFTHPLGKQKPLAIIFNRGPFKIGGSANTIAKSEFRYYAPYHVDAGPSMRQIVDLADPDHVESVLAGGQSGQPFSTHYDDQIAFWRDGEYKRADMRRTEVEQQAATKQVLHP